MGRVCPPSTVTTGNGSRSSVSAATASRCGTITTMPSTPQPLRWSIASLSADAV